VAPEQDADQVFLSKREVRQSNVPDAHSVAVRRPLGVMAGFTLGTAPASWGRTSRPMSSTSSLHAPSRAEAVVGEFFAGPDVRVINLSSGDNAAHLPTDQGGLNPTIVLDDVDMDHTVRSATIGVFLQKGRICLNTRTPPSGDPPDPSARRSTIRTRVPYGASSILAGDTHRGFEPAPRPLHGIRQRRLAHGERGAPRADERRARQRPGLHRPRQPSPTSPTSSGQTPQVTSGFSPSVLKSNNCWR